MIAVNMLFSTMLPDAIQGSREMGKNSIFFVNKL